MGEKFRRRTGASQSLSPEDVARIVADSPLDPGFLAELDAAAGATIDEL